MKNIFESYYEPSLCITINGMCRSLCNKKGVISTCYIPESQRQLQERREEKPRQ